MHPPSPDDDHPALREALRRDAARLPEPSFDDALHAATMRRIRALTQTTPSRARRGWALTAAAGAAALLALGLWTQPRHDESIRFRRELTRRGEPPPITVAVSLPRASQWAYQRAAAQGDEDLFALLERDARALLPPTPPVFSDLPGFPDPTDP